VPPVLDIRDLEIRFATPDGVVEAANKVSLSVEPGETLGIVGESGSGKSQVFMAVMGLLASNGRATGSVKFQGEEILGRKPAELNKIRGARMSMIFQDPMTSLNPYLTIERQLTEVLETHRGMSSKEARQAAVDMLERVQIPEADRRISHYPFEFSGGMRQRAMIAMALLCQPELLIADEPTTALDVRCRPDPGADGRAQAGGKTSFVVITHDLGVIAGLCDRVLVMYAGRAVETGPVRDIFKSPQHPYTAGLLASMPRLDETEVHRLTTIPGQPPNLQRLPPGCAFSDRCPRVFDLCHRERPPFATFAPGRMKACHLPHL
jgi:oligopeptide/dipeptide ABC transporter, ATP-binding protein, C-terminal domain